MKLSAALDSDERHPSRSSRGSCSAPDGLGRLRWGQKRKRPGALSRAWPKSKSNQDVGHQPGLSGRSRKLRSAKRRVGSANALRPRLGLPRRRRNVAMWFPVVMAWEQGTYGRPRRQVLVRTNIQKTISGVAALRSFMKPQYELRFLLVERDLNREPGHLSSGAFDLPAGAGLACEGCASRKARLRRLRGDPDTRVPPRFGFAMVRNLLLDCA